MKVEDLRFSSSSVDDFFGETRRTASSSNLPKVRISSLQHLAGFQFVTSDTLVRLSKNDFWKLGHDEEGDYIERLVSDDNGPIKEA
ncbi:MAG TPA: hypothetical protein VIE65_22960 [Methylobacter sp.]